MNEVIGSGDVTEVKSGPVECTAADDGVFAPIQIRILTKLSDRKVSAVSRRLATNRLR